ncbi:RNB domain-containing ribonuclease [Georgenia sp.]
MPARHLGLATAPPAPVRRALEGLRAELGVHDSFPPTVEAEADVAEPAAPPPVDATDVPFVTIDPPGARDLDQALHIERADAGYLVRYAIAAVSEFVVPGGAIDREAHERGVTVYGPDRSFPLHPPALSAGVASLLPDQDRPAYLWHLRLAADGALPDVRVELALVRSRAQLTYEQVQAAHDDGGVLPDAVPADLPELLRTVGRLRQDRERARGGVSLDIPEQRVEQNSHGFVLTYRATLPVEGWNAQLSLLTGIAAARVMRAAGVGILRTLPDADPRDLERLRRSAVALGVPWPDDTPYGEMLRTLDSTVPAHAAFLNEATTLFRGAGYLPFGVGGAADDATGNGSAPTSRHSAIAAEYAHVTAPLRRLVDRYGLAVCLAHCTGRPVPGWVLDALRTLPATMARTTQRANSYERGAVNALEALVLEGRVGEVFEGVLVEVDGRERNGGAAAADDGTPATQRGIVVLGEPAVEGTVEGTGLPLGERIRVRLTEVDVARRRVRFALA